MVQRLYADLLELLDSKFQADEFVNQLNGLIEELYNKNVDVSQKIKITIPSPKSDKIITIIQNNGINLSDTIRIQTVLQDIKEIVLSIPVVIITIPYEAKEEELKRLTAWFNLNLQSKVFPKFIFDNSLIGGAAIGFKGKYKEYSIVKDLEQLFETGTIKKYMEITQNR